jgi:hypothetical protein
MSASSESNDARAREAEVLAVPSAATGPATATASVIIERPDSPLARGSVPFPAWGIALVGASVVVLGLVVLFFSIRSRRR